MVPRHRIVYRGDTKQCSIYLPFARNLLSMAARTKASVLLKRFNLSDWCRVHYKPNGISTIYIDAAPPFGYMETGFLDWRVVLFKSAETYMPSTVRFNNFVSTLSGLPDEGKYINASQSRPLVDGDLSWALGCKGTVESITIVDPLTDEQKSFTSFSPGFCSNTGTLYKRKLAQAHCPPSVFTGRMRKYMQAVYGSKDHEYEGEWGLKGGHVKVYSNEFLKDENGEFIVDIFGDRVKGNISLYPYTFSGATIVKVGETWVMIEVGEYVTLRKMNPVFKPADNPEISRDPDIMEFYELATLVPAAQSVAIANISDYTSNWIPTAYGWHFDMTGTHAVCAVHRYKQISGEDFYGSPALGNGWECLLLSLDVSITIAEDGTLGGSANVTVEETVDYLPLVQQFIYFPDYLSNDKMQLAIEGFAGVYINSGNAPVYAYYDINDDLKIVRCKNSTWTSEPTFFDSDLNSSNATLVFGITCWASDTHTRNGLLFKDGAKSFSGASLSVGDTTYNGDGESYTISQWLEYHITGSRFTTGTTNFTEVCGHTDPLPFRTVPFEWYSIGTFESYKELLEKSNHGKISKPFLVIPFGDASAVIAGKQDTVSGDYTLHNTREQSGNILKKVDGDFVKTSTSGMAFNLTATPLTEDPDLTGENDFYVNNQSGSMSLHNAHGTRLIDSFTDSTMAYLNDEPVYVLANPQNIVSMPWYGIRVAAASSYNGASWWSFEGLELQDSENWPKGMSVVGNPVGWA